MYTSHLLYKRTVTVGATIQISDAVSNCFSSDEWSLKIKYADTMTVNMNILWFITAATKKVI